MRKFALIPASSKTRAIGESILIGAAAAFAAIPMLLLRAVCALWGVSLPRDPPGDGEVW